MMAETSPSGSQLLFICGLSFSGKSTLGKAIAERFGYEAVDVDETKINLYGQRIKDEDLVPEDWARIYTETDQLIENLLKSGKSVLDASRNFSKTERNIVIRAMEPPTADEHPLIYHHFSEIDGWLFENGTKLTPKYTSL
jgi:predicted kinase